MKIVENTFKGKGLTNLKNLCKGEIKFDASPVIELLKHCPVSKITPLLQNNELTNEIGIKSLFFKDERTRMGLGSFKALGGSYVIAKEAFKNIGPEIKNIDKASTALKGKTFVTASAGNHGLSVAAGARVFGAKAVIYLSVSVPKNFIDRLKSYGAEVVLEGEDYETSMAAAVRASEENKWFLLSDVTWEGYSKGIDVMEGYLVMASEAVDQWNGEPPTHVFLQTGCGGLSAAVSAHLRKRWGEQFIICTVEPEAAPAMLESILKGTAVHTSGPVSNMGRLDCKAPSHVALKCLAKEVDYLMTLSDEFVAKNIRILNDYNLETSPSGGAGFAGLIACSQSNMLDINKDSKVLIFISEGSSDD